MKQKRTFWGRMLSVFLALTLCMSGLVTPVQAAALNGLQDEPEEMEISEPEEIPESPEKAEEPQEQPSVYFQYDDGRTQEMGEDDTFTLTPLDAGKFVLEGTDKTPEWDCSADVVTDPDSSQGGGVDGEHMTHYWIESDGRYVPFDVRTVDARVLNSENTSEVLAEFQVDTVPSQIAELKTFIGDQEVSMDKPYHVQGNESVSVTLKARVEGSEEWVNVPSSAIYYEKVSGPGLVYGAGTIEMTGDGEAVFKLTMYEDRTRLFKEFKMVSGKVPLESFELRVPKVWYIDSWNILEGYWVGIRRGDGEEEFNYTCVPENASDQTLVWEALTPEIAEYMEYFDNGIVPKKAGIAKFKVYSRSNPQLSKDVTIDFRYKYPLEKAEPEKKTYKVEQGEFEEFQILPTPSNASEQRFNWSYSQDGIVKITDEVQTDHSALLPKRTVHTIQALKAGEVTVKGVPWDTTAGCEPVEFTIQVTKDGEVPDATEYTALAKDDIAHGVKYLQKQSTKAYGDEWNIFTILRAGESISQENLDAYYKSVSEKLHSSAVNSRKFRYTDVARVSITLAAMGKDLTDVDGVNLMKMIYNDELKTKMNKETSNCPIWGLIALDCQDAEIPSDAVWTREKLIERILSYQTAEGGFGLTDNKTSSIDMTGMALQALAPYKNLEKVKPAFDKALQHFRDNITPNAGFTDAGKENSCTVAQVLTALTAAGIDPLDKENGFTAGNKNIVGNLHTYKGEQGFLWQAGLKPDVMATQQVTYAMEAYRRFVEGENRLYDCTDSGNEAENQEAAKKVTEQIQALGEITEYAQKAEVEAARKAYDELTEEQKAYVTEETLAILEKAEKEIQSLGKIQTVIEKINAIGEEITLDSKEIIEDARKAYEKLTEAQKKLVTNYDKLTKAEEELQKLEEQKPEEKGHVVVSVERFTIGQGYYQEPVEVPLDKGDTAASILRKVIEDKFIGSDDWLEGIADADLGADKVEVPAYISEKLGGPTTEEARDYGNDGDEDLEFMEYGDYAEWSFTANNKLKGAYDLQGYQPKNGDVLRFQFSLMEGPDINGCEWDSAEPVVGISNKDELTSLMAAANKEDSKKTEAVKEAYDKAVELISAMITPQKEIDAAAEKLKRVMEGTQEPGEADKKAAKAVIEKIEAIGEKITLDSKEAIEEARKAYDGLTDAQKKLVTNYDKLTKAEEKLQKLEEQQKEDEKAAKAVIEKINAIGEKITLESKEAIEEARKAYDGLTDAQKKLVTNIDKLTKAEEELQKLEEQKPGSGHVVISVERFTIGQGYIYEPVYVPFEEGENAATLLKKVIGAENFVGQDEYLEAIVGGDLGTDKVVIPEYIEKISDGKVTTETARELGNEDNGDGGDALGEFDYSSWSGWMYHVNGVEVGYGITAYEPKDGDVLRFQFTMYGYGTDLTGKEYGNDVPVIDICNKDSITKLMADVNENREELMAVPAVKAAYDKAVELISAVITPEAEIKAAEEALRKAVEHAQNGSADTIELIKAIGNNVTLDSKEAIVAARKAYDGLTEAQKKLVTNVDKLTEAEKELQKLEDKKAASEVVEKINAIGEKITLESKPAIEEARKAYDKLTEVQKKLVINFDKLTKAEGELQKLEAEQNAADEKAAKAVIEKINAIGDKVTLDSKKAIEEARKAYDGLTEAQKKLVTNIDKLTKAEEELQKLQSGNQNKPENPDDSNKPESVGILVNEKYGIALEGKGLTTDMQLTVTPIGKDHADVERMRKEITSDKSVFRLYDIKLMKNGKEIELPSESVLSIPVGEKYNGKELTVLHCKKSEVEKLTGKVTDGSVQVKINSLSSFGVVIDTPAADGGNGSGNNGNKGSSGTGNSSNSGSGQKGTAAKTGDEAPIEVLLMLLAASVALGTVVYRKQNKR